MCYDRKHSSCFLSSISGYQFSIKPGCTEQVSLLFLYVGHSTCVRRLLQHAGHCRPVNSHNFVMSLTILGLISHSHDKIIMSHNLKALATHILLRMCIRTSLS